jgi:hypothetical protein
MLISHIRRIVAFENRKNIEPNLRMQPPPPAAQPPPPAAVNNHRFTRALPPAYTPPARGFTPKNLYAQLYYLFNRRRQVHGDIDAAGAPRFAQD